MKKFLSIFTMASFLFACSKTPNTGTEISGSIYVDGSSTVFPITEAVAEEFMISNKNVRVNVGVSGTGGGFKKFCLGETTVNNASRKIKKSEVECLKNKNIRFEEIPVAFDGISIVVNKKNTWVNDLSVAELKKLWEPNSKVTTWKDLRAKWPAEKITLYGPGTDSGTFDYFTHVINGKEQASRSDYTKSEDDNTIVRGVSGDKNGLGYFGFAYYQNNKDKLKVIAIKEGSKKAVLPSEITINSGEYSPLSRPMFIYVNRDKLESEKTAKHFLLFYLKNAAILSAETGYIALPQNQYSQMIESYEQNTSAR